MSDSKTEPRKPVIEITLALLVGFVVGVIFSACKLPLPAPPMLAGVMGIIGIYAGGQVWQLVAEKFFS